MNPFVMTLVLVSTLAFFSWSVKRRFRQLMIGVADPKFDWSPEQVFERTKATLIYAFGQKKMAKKDSYQPAGVAHIMIFIGFQVLLLNSLMLWGRGYWPEFDFWGVLSTNNIVGQGYSFAKEATALLVVIGASVFAYLRFGKKGDDSGDPDEVQDKPRMTVGLEPKIILGIIITMMLADFLYVAAHLALEARANGSDVHLAWYEPIASPLALVMQSMGWDALKVIEHAGFWWHASFVLIFLNILPYTKHFHILTVIPNVFALDLNPAGLPKLDDIEGRMEREEAVGIRGLEDLSYSHILDLYTCTECGRCSDNCPAYITDKKLSPKHLTLALRNHLYSTEDVMFNGATPEKEEELDALHTTPAAPEGGYFESEIPMSLLPSIVHPDVIWACTSCRACEEQCPVMISYVDKIVGLRRQQVMWEGDFPTVLGNTFNGIESNGNPWNISKMDRAKWSDGQDVPFMKDHPNAAVLYWVGCAAAYDDRAKKVARATVKLLKHAGVDFAILGTEETCTGDPARRAGNEFLFQTLAEQNIETLNGYGVDKKTIVTACPHCLNTLANEYPDFGGKYDVVHHTAFINGLIARKKLVPTKPVTGKMVFHDSCYLGRYNDVYEAPREILQSIEGIELVEVPYWNKEKGLCCGGGGAQVFMEEQHSTDGEMKPVAKKRTLQLLDTGAKTIASGCPFCMVMLNDGLTKTEKVEEIEQRDVAEILVDAIDFGAEAAE